MIKNNYHVCTLIIPINRRALDLHAAPESVQFALTYVTLCIFIRQRSLKALSPSTSEPLTLTTFLIGCIGVSSSTVDRPSGIKLILPV